MIRYGRPIFEKIQAIHRQRNVIDQDNRGGEDQASVLSVKEFMINMAVENKKIIWKPPEII